MGSATEGLVAAGSAREAAATATAEVGSATEGLVAAGSAREAAATATAEVGSATVAAARVAVARAAAVRGPEGCANTRAQAEWPSSRQVNNYCRTSICRFCTRC